MSDLGELLKKAREQSGMSLDDIQESTKIRKRYLEAIESGDYKVLPGSFYVRAFVKTYAETLGLNADDVLRLYKHEMPAAPPDPAVEPMIKQPRRASQTSSDRWSKFGFTGIMLSFVIVIAAVVWIYAINNSDTNDNAHKVDDQTKITDSTDIPKETEPNTTTDQQPNTNTGTTGNDTGTNVPAQQPEPPVQATTVTLSGKSGRVDLYDVGPSGDHQLKFTVKGGTSWIEVREGGSKGKELYSGLAADGTEQTFPLTGSTYMNVGRADLVEISIDDVVVEDGNRTTTKKLQFNPVSADAGTGTGTGTNKGTDTGTGTNATNQDQAGEVQNVQ
ncbi:cytoskeleton protein RodZ [Paenibacillus cellulosilyticus]|uniref:Cytoskeleton protein RodZ n=1 Tax=Paenibacillus cellulosilyticus TaxID=375489 RepID=A0A2V2YXW7_9BACL|nr:RodZ family helix-turn-helix domain-containing protein [Paenibacillus cellulosilyticus]PWW06464.1 cytoskeleton protein RodZ [Paenibacillus cellulosilyticus]QKS46192.1 helix-turn-helix domain-containing protein [Paenibacillus cellulosilyticus]